ncbi:MAG: alanine dehydrogenase [Gammaproteobacteria bacterium]|nr:alanine dehydrogenase [Gammaproteobacteria bacterium]
MQIGIPREIKPLEGRVALSPEACGDLVQAGHNVFVEQKAGILSGFSDQAYQAVGATITASPAETYDNGQLIVKVKEPLSADLALLQKNHLLFCFLHLAANPELAHSLLDIGLTGIAFETVETDDHVLPLLAPMSDIAGRLATQIGSNLLHQPAGGKGLLLGGLPGTERGRVVIIGAGNAGGNAALMAAAMGAEVTVFDLDRERLADMRRLGNNVTGLYPYQDTVRQAVAGADLLIGAVLRTGKRSPHVVTRNMVASMTAGSVIVDISVDQGGCIETTRPTTYEAPTYLEEGVLHFTVTNIPGAVPRSASQALSAVLLPYVHKLAEPDWKISAELQRGINVEAGQLIHPALKESLD